MPAFEYQAFNKKGKKSNGVHEADTARQVRSYLREQGLTPLKIEQVAERAKQTGSGLRFKSKVSTTDLALLTRQLATLVAAAMPIEESLKAVAQQSEKPKLKSIILGVRSKVVEGYSLADSMKDFPEVFEKLYCAMVAAGEKSGHLDKVLERLADYTEQRQAMRMKTMQALIYPAVLTFVCLAVIAILLVSVVPKVVAQFEHMGQELPGATQFLIALSELVSHYGLFFLISVMLALVVWQRLLQKDNIRMQWHQRILSLPVLGKVSKGLNTARFARTLSILNASAVPLLEGMRISGEVLANEKMKAAVAEAAVKVSEGASLKASLDQTKLFPPMMLHMIASGEKSGELENMLARAADNQDREFEALVNITVSIIGPAMVLSMAGIVFFIVISILQPIMALNSMVG